MTSDTLRDIAKKIATSIESSKITLQTKVSIGPWVADCTYCNQTDNMFRFTQIGVNSSNQLEGFSFILYVNNPTTSVATGVGWSLVNPINADKVTIKFR